MPTRPTRPRLQSLEDRTTPVVGAFDVPAGVGTGNAFLRGVVTFGDSPDPAQANSSGALLDNGRFVLTAAHCVDADGDKRPDAATYFVRFDLPAGAVTVPVAASDIAVHPNWGGNDLIADGSDVAVMRLPYLAPFGNGTARLGYGLYTQTNEVGRQLAFAGYGYTGTGTTGEAIDANGNSAEVQRLRVNGTGPVRLAFNGGFVDLPANTAAAVEAALESQRGVNDVRVVTVNSPGNPNNGAFEVVFVSVDPTTPGFAGINVPQAQLVARPGFSGSLSSTTLADGTRLGVKRSAVNTFARAFAGGVLEADFPATAGVGVLGAGDSGGPAFLDGLIAGIASFGSDPATLGATTDWARVSSFVSSFIQPFLATASPTLVVDLSAQPGTSDGVTDQVRVLRDGTSVRVFLNGLLIFDGLQSAVTSVDVRAGADPVNVVQDPVPTPTPTPTPGPSPTPTPTPVPEPLRTLRAVAAGPGGGPQVLVLDAAGGQVVRSFFAYDPLVTAGVTVATGDVTGDGVSDIITAPGVGFAPHVKVFDGVTGALVHSFFAFDPVFTGGLFVAAGDIDGDGRADVVVGTAAGSGVVSVFSGRDASLMRSFFAFTPFFVGGVRVAAGDVDGDGRADLIAGAGPGGGPVVSVFRGTDLALLQSFFVYNPLVATGVYVAAADVDGDGRADVVTGAGEGFAPHVRAVRVGDGAELASFFAFDPTLTTGVRVGPEAAAGGGRSGFAAATGPGATPLVATFGTGDLAPLGVSSAFNPAFLGGVFVG